MSLMKNNNRCAADYREKTALIARLLHAVE